MQKQRLVHGWTNKQVAEAFGCSRAHISRIEQGRKPTRALVQFYDETFQCEGLLLSLFEVVDGHAEQERRRAGGRRPPLRRALPGDASSFESDTIPHGTLMKPGEVFQKVWRIRNSGTVPWRGRQLERQGPLTGPGLISSTRHYPISATEPGELVEIPATLKAPTYDCASIAYFKMVDAEGQLCFPQSYALRLDVMVLVRGQMRDQE
jgi:transcriptional regulator with XRE-family HTH domain